MFKNILTVTLLSLVLIGCGVSTSGLPAIDETAGRSPRGYEIGKSNASIVAEAREHLEDLARKGIHERLTTIVYFNELIPLEELDAMVSSYNIKGGRYGGALTVLVGDDDVVGMSFDDPLPTAAEMKAEVDASNAEFSQALRNEWEFPDAPKFAVMSVSMFPADALQFWNRDYRVRLVGVVGQGRNSFGAWRPVLPAEPFR